MMRTLVGSSLVSLIYNGNAHQSVAYLAPLRRSYFCLIGKLHAVDDNLHHVNNPDIKTESDQYALEVGRRLIASINPQTGMNQEYFRSAIQQGAKVTAEQTNVAITDLMKLGELEYQFGKGAVPGKSARLAAA